MYITAKYLRPLYQTSDWGVQAYQLQDNTTAKITGSNLPDQPGIHYRLSGTWTIHPRYGRQYSVESWEIEGVTRDDTIAYLCTLSGIGKKTAGKIADALGQDTIRILRKDPDNLLMVKGLSKKVINTAIPALRETADILKIFEQLAPFGFTMTHCKAIVKDVAANIEEVIRYPYDLCRVTGVTFSMADAYALNNGITKDDPERIRCAAQHVLLTHEVDTGSTGMEKPSFLKELGKLTGIRIEEYIDQISWSESVCFINNNGEDLVFRHITWWREKVIAEQLLELLSNHDTSSTDFIQKVMDDVAASYADLSLSSEQKEAVRTAAQNRVSVITGYPGTGKTTVIRVIAEVIRRLYGLDCLCLAPTGIAARRIAACSGLQAKTIHSALQIYDEEGSADAELTDLLVIVDETSMLSTTLLWTLVCALRGHSRIIFIGDTDQLQSIGAGAVLRDMVCAGVPVTRLTKVYRSNGKSTDLDENAERIRHGNPQLTTSKGFITYFGLSNTALEDKMLRLYLLAVKKFGPDSACLIAPVKDGPAGVNNLNLRAREMLNPAAWGKQEMSIGGTVYRKGDRVMELINSDTSVNGDIGYVDEIDAAAGTLTVRFLSGSATVYTKEDRDRLALAYAMTVHKAQGSEYDVIITCLQDENVYMKRRSIIYTAFTRAKKFAVFCGSAKALAAAIRTDDTKVRKTGLQELLKKKWKKEGDEDSGGCP